MARLNEAPALAAESVEALKRRFIRQNREIARVNSNQSIRIRNLETEISRLLAENIAIREDAINARAEAEKWRASHRLNKEVVRMKEQLELKLSEVSALVGDLGALPEKIARRSSQRRRQGGLMSELVKPMEEKEPRQRQTLLEQEGRLPAILEDKHYPRRTLDTYDIQILTNLENGEATESPELGSPPVAHFDEPEALTFNPARSPRRTSTELIEEKEGANKQSAILVENRRKRRTSALLQSSVIDHDTADVSQEPELTVPEPIKRDAPVAPRPILKTGAKRKLEASELEDTNRVSKELDDFIFQRKATTAPVVTARQSRFSRPPGRHGQENAEKNDNVSPERSTQPARKILAPKSTNSPAKKSLITSSDKPGNVKVEELGKVPERRTVSRIRTKPAPIDTLGGNDVPLELERDIHDAENQARFAPKTPATGIDDVMSPISTEPSMKQRLPKEMAMTNSVEDVLNGSIGRGTRRARAPVNYAQPNLRDKMRRPGKELVGAVEGLVKLQADLEADRSAAKVNSAGVESAKQYRRANSATEIKEDQQKEQTRWRNLENGQGGKSEPASPLRGKIAPSLRTGDQEVDAADDLSQAVSKLCVLDLHKSISMTNDVEQSINADQPMSTVRRHSTLARPSESATPSIGTTVSRSRRPNSTSGVRQSESQEEAESDRRKGHVRKSASVTSLPPTSQLNRRTGLASKEVVPSEMLQSEAIESRTRSSTLTRRKSTDDVGTCHC